MAQLTVGATIYDSLYVLSRITFLAGIDEYSTNGGKLIFFKVLIVVNGRISPL